MNRKELKRYRERLLEELETLVDSRRRLERVAREGVARDSGDSTTYSGHGDDLGSEAAEREKDLLLAARGSQTAREIGEALRRIDAGTYGACEDCGKPVAVKRLELIPYARRCAKCQLAAERNV